MFIITFTASWFSYHYFVHVSATLNLFFVLILSFRTGFPFWFPLPCWPVLRLIRSLLMAFSCSTRPSSIATSNYRRSIWFSWAWCLMFTDGWCAVVLWWRLLSPSADKIEMDLKFPPSISEKCKWIWIIVISTTFFCHEVPTPVHLLTVIYY